MIVQNIGKDGTTDFTFTVHRGDYPKALEILKETAARARRPRGAATTSIVKVSLVGVGHALPRRHRQQDVQGPGQEGINIRMISTSEIKISVVVDEKYLELAVRTLHEAFDVRSLRWLEGLVGRGPGGNPTD
jgi:aspartate kinase